MFNKFSPAGSLIDFTSNPPLPDGVQVVPVLSDEGVVRNEVRSVARDNRSLLDGFHFSSDVHSLRAKLNLGVMLRPVPPIVKDNDPAVVSKKLENLERTISNRLDAITSNPDLSPGAKTDFPPGEVASDVAS